ncbi:MAG: membrane protein [Gemmatimonadales bacterium]|nr:MAG: membrane protein [Gemmatimonadales bacterium]
MRAGRPASLPSPPVIARLLRRAPTAAAFGLYAAAVGLAFLPFWAGRILINPYSDQRLVYPFRKLAVEYWKRHGDAAPWNPYIFGGMPFAANVTNGDTFYPLGILPRLLMPVDLGITFGFLLHLVLAGGFMFLLLRAWKLEWGPAFIGGAAYMFTGQLISLVTAGHDGKLAVSALLPLALLCLYRAVSRGSWRWYLGFGGVVGLSLLSPHVQLTYYLLMAAGFFWLFMVALSGERPASHGWLRSGLLFTAGLIAGFALAGIQLIPFAEYIGYSPRGAPGSTSTGWEYATSWAMPPEELLNVVWPTFSGMLENYWGRNFFKLHSEYLGVVSLVLATFGLGYTERRRYVWFAVFLIAYATLFALGGHTPFYRLPYHLLPGIKLTRAPSMIFFLASFGVAVLAAFGAARLTRIPAQARLHALAWWLGILGAASLLALAGGWKGLMLSLVPAGRVSLVENNYPVFVWDSVRVLVFAGALAGSIVLLKRQRLQPLTWALVAGLLVLLDLWSVERRHIRFGPRAEELFAADQVIKAIEPDSGIYRVLPIPTAYSQDNYFMIHGIRTVLGYQGTELHRYDELLGGKNVWRNIGNPNIWKLLAVRYVLLDQPVSFPGLDPVGPDGAGDAAPLLTYEGQRVYLYRYRDAQPYARVVSQALKVPDDQALGALLNSRFDPTRLLLVPPDAPAGVENLDVLPPAVDIAVASEQVAEGRYRFELREPVREAGYLFVSENWYPAWRATVDGARAPVLRAQFSLMAVPLARGSRVVELEFDSTSYRIGRMVSLSAVLVLVLAAALPLRRTEGAGEGEKSGGE